MYISQRCQFYSGPYGKRVESPLTHKREFNIIEIFILLFFSTFTQEGLLWIHKLHRYSKNKTTTNVSCCELESVKPFNSTTMGLYFVIKRVKVNNYRVVNLSHAGEHSLWILMSGYYKQNYRRTPQESQNEPQTIWNQPPATILFRSFLDIIKYPLYL